MKNYCFTLGYNLVTEIAKTTKLLYDLNDRDTFTHLIVDLGFPLERGDEIPEDITGSKLRNSEALKALAAEYGSDYVKMQNIGVSQNWTQVYKHLKPEKDDILIGTDPDEHPMKKGWVKAMGDVMRTGNYALCSLMMTDHIPLMGNIPYREKFVAGHRVYIAPNGTLNWALIGIMGSFLDLMGEVPYPKEAPIYGWIEGSMYPYMERYRQTWCILADHLVKHTDFSNGDAGSSPLLRAWKNQLVYEVKTKGQVSFDQWLIRMKNAK